MSCEPKKTIINMPEDQEIAKDAAVKLKLA